MRIATLIWVIIAALTVGAMPAGAATRVALVIGNSAYQNVPFLPNPINDASDLSASLKRLGFDVKTVTDARYDDMRRSLIDFSQQANGAEIALIFFAGHGIQIDGENWLIPVDAQLATDLNVANETIGLQSLTRAVSNTSRLGLVMLDACRNNPFLRKMQGRKLSRAVERGFSRVEPSDNVLVAFAARDGTTADDGSGRNSPFTQSLLKNIETPGLEITFMFRNIRDDVMAATQREQQPYVYGSLSREMIYLKPPSSAPAAVGNVASPSEKTKVVFPPLNSGQLAKAITADKIPDDSSSKADQPKSLGDDTGGYAVQIASQRSEVDALGALKALQDKFPSVLGSAPSFIRRTDLGDRGVYYRGMIGPFASSAEAAQFCSNLKAAGGQCVVQRAQAPEQEQPSRVAKLQDKFSSSDQPAPVPQRVVLYDEDPADAKGKQYVGTVTWRIEPIKAIGGNPADVAMRGDIEIPSRKFKMTISLRRNLDTSLPASHTAELTFPPDANVANVPGILMKSNEQARGTPLAGLAVKVTDGFFLMGLSNVDSDRARNMQLLKERTWFDIPLVYKNQRRAIIAIEKGESGGQIQTQALAAWGQ